jgi:uncharacterized protein (TIGR03437 family)
MFKATLFLASLLIFSVIAAAQPTIVEYVLPSASAGASGVTKGPDGNLWVCENTANKIARVSSGGSVVEYSLPQANSGPLAIVSGPDGNLWFTERNRIGKITPAGVVSEYPLSSAFASPAGIAAGPDGNIWFTEPYANAIGRITTSGSITEYQSSGMAYPFNIAPGPDGALWFTETISKVGRITTAGVITEYPLSPGVNVNSVGFNPGGIAAGADGNLWFAGDSTIWRVTTDGALTSFLLPTGSAGFQGITAGPDGNLWLTESSSSKVARLTTAGVLSEYPIATASSQPGPITAGTDGNLWFTESAGNKVAKLVPSTAPVAALLTVSPSSVTFTGSSGGSAPPTQTIAVTASGTAAYSVSSSVVVSFGPAWLTISPSGSVTGSQSFTVSANQFDMGTYGAYNGSIALVSGNVTQFIPVTLNITAPPTGGNILASPSALSFTYLVGNDSPPFQEINTSSAVQGAFYIPITISTSVASPSGGSWLSLTTAGGSPIANGGSLTTGVGILAKVNPQGLAAGTYSASITIAPSGGSSVTVPVTLTVTAPASPISLSPGSLSFTYIQGTPVVQTQTHLLTESGSGIQPWFATIKNRSSWLSITPSGGNAPATMSVGVLASGLPAGVYSDQIVVTTSLSSSSPSTIVPVTLTISASRFTEYAIPTAGSSPGSITAGTDGKIWFVDYTSGTGKVGNIAPSGEILEYSFPHATFTAPSGITSGPDGNIWVAEGEYIAKVTPGGTITEYSAHGLIPATIITGPDGNVWFGDLSFGILSKITPSGVVTSYTLPGVIIYALAAGPDGNIWIADRFNSKIGRVTPSGQITEFALNPASGAGGITIGADGNLWIAQADQIGKMTMSGALTEYSAKGARTNLPIALGPDGCAWFVTTNGIAEITQGGTVIGYPDVALSAIYGLGAGPDGNIWFTEATGKIGKLALVAAPPVIASVVNAASLNGPAVAPGEIVTIFGSGMGPLNPLGLTLGADGKVMSALGGVSVTFSGYPAPLLYVSSTQINCVVPYETASTIGAIPVEVISGSQRSGLTPLPAVRSAPGVITLNGSGSGLGAILTASGAVNGPGNPASAGSTITFYVTGEGQTAPAGVTGAVTVVAKAPPITPQPLASLSVTIGGKPASVSFEGEAPGFVSGVMQVNAVVPAGLSPGNQPLLVSLGGIESQFSVTVYVQ